MMGLSYELKTCSHIHSRIFLLICLFSHATHNRRFSASDVFSNVGDSPGDVRERLSVGGANNVFLYRVHT